MRSRVAERKSLSAVARVGVEWRHPKLAQRLCSASTSSGVAAKSFPTMKPNKAFAPDFVPRHTLVFPFMSLLYKLYMRLGRSRVRGRRNVPQTGPVILAPNHVSMLDPPLVGISCGRWPYTMAKAELFVGAFGWVIEQMGTFPIHRGQADRRALKIARRLLDAGEALLIFPEGTRTRDGELSEAEIGVAMLAHASKAAVVPIFIAGTGGALSLAQPGAALVRTEIRFGKPLPLDDLYAQRGNRETLEAINARLMSAIKALGNEGADGQGRRIREARQRKKESRS